MAKLRGVGRLADTLLQSHLAQNQADYQNQLELGRQQSMAKLQHYLSMQDAAAKDPALALRLKQAGEPGMEGYVPSSDDQMAPVTEEIAKSQSPEQLGSLRGRFEQLRNRPGPVDLNQVQSLADTYNAQHGQIEANDAAKLKDAIALTKGNAEAGVTGKVAGETASRAENIANTNAIELGTRPGVVARAGATAGAAAGAAARAQHPYSKPDIFYDDKGSASPYRWGPAGAEPVQGLPPGMTENIYREPAQIQARKQAAVSALGSIQEARGLLDSMDKRGLLGPIVSRINQFTGSGIKAEDALLRIDPREFATNPEDAGLVGDFFTSFGLLASQAAVAHGGARGGGSPQLAKQFEKLINGLGDPSVTRGQLNSLERLMQKYAADPNSPPELDLKQYGFQDETGPAPLTPRLQRRLGGN